MDIIRERVDTRMEKLKKMDGKKLAGKSSFPYFLIKKMRGK